MSDSLAGVIYEQKGNVINIKTEGCIDVGTSTSEPNICNILPDKDTAGTPVATGIHVFINGDVTHFEVTGIKPSFANLFGSSWSGAFSAPSCVINAPAEMTSMTSNTDICLDVTHQPDVDFFAISGQAVTYHTISTATMTRVNDCFATNSNTIIDLITQEVWKNNNNGSYDKIK